MAASTWYCTLEDVSEALDWKASARADRQIRRAIAAGARDVDDVAQWTDGFFRPLHETRYFTWPPEQTTSYWRLWLDANGLISIDPTGLVVAGTALASSNYYLEPQAYGPPYDRIEINRGGSSAFTSDTTAQRSIAVTGWWGHSDTQEPAGSLVGGINAVVTALTVSDGSLVGIGDLLTLESERVVVTDRTWVDSAQNVPAGGLASSSSAVTIALAGGNIAEGETVLIDSERMLVTDVTGTTLTVKRARDGTTLATHLAAADVYVNRGLTVERGARGSTAAAHLDAQAITRHVVPEDAQALNVGSALARLLGEQAGYSREPSSTGGGAGSRPATRAPGIGLDQLRSQIACNYGRQARMRVV